jgi:hypothetical protein
MKTTRYHHLLNNVKNEKDVLNFFIFIENLSDDQLIAYGKEYQKINWNDRDNMWDYFNHKMLWMDNIIKNNIFMTVPGDKLNGANSWYIRNLILYAANELMASKEILESGRSFVFIPCFLNL